MPPFARNHALHPWTLSICVDACSRSSCVGSIWLWMRKRTVSKPVFGVSKTSISGFVALGPRCISIYILCSIKSCRIRWQDSHHEQSKNSSLWNWQRVVSSDIQQKNAKTVHCGQSTIATPKRWQIVRGMIKPVHGHTWELRHLFSRWYNPNNQPALCSLLRSRTSFLPCLWIRRVHGGVVLIVASKWPL